MALGMGFWQFEVAALNNRICKLAGLLVVATTIAAPLRADEPVDYLGQIKPVLQARCYACHGVLKQEAGLRLDTAALAVRGGDSGAAIEPMNAAGSLLLARVTAPDESERMPPEGEPLSQQQIGLIEAWVTQGAHGPADELPERDPRDHWAFKTPVRPPVPTVADSDWNQNPIDAFIEAQRAQRGIVHQPPADKGVWLRRVYLDLVGLPPTRAELDAFVASDSPQTRAAVVNQLLDSPQYGERWGRHWMDIWRYSDWWGLGAEVRNSQKHIWHWRDWIIESLNADKGYDQMLREMLAADELYPNDLDRLRASGFLARQYFKFNRTSWLDETVEHTAKAMLGMTFNCAKCHDHKYDPFLQVDYYQLRAVFEPYQVRTDQVPGQADFEQDGIPRAFDCNLDAQTFLHIRGDDRNPDKSRPLPPAVPGFLSQGEWKVEPVPLPPEAAQPGLRPFVVDNYLQAAEAAIVAARTALETARAKPAESEAVQQLIDNHLAKVLAAAEAQPAAIRARGAAEQARVQQPSAEEAAALAREASRLERAILLAAAEEAAAKAELDLGRAAADKQADFETKFTAAQAAVETAKQAAAEVSESFTPLAGSLKTLESNLETEESRRRPFPTTSSGRRTALAAWITDPRHPLPARVAVNHLWLRHFGRPLVATVFDFGRKGIPPTHPELLDWLAVELVEQGWSMKHIHRLIVTSRTYAMTSSSAEASAASLAHDPDNRFYWRAKATRMDAQVIRDSLLHLAGALDATAGGPPIPANDPSSRRRSLYFFHSHNEHQPFLSMFDDASVLDCYRRTESIVPQQALALENSPLAMTLGDQIAHGIAAEHPDAPDPEYIRSAFLTVLAVEPTEDELRLASDGLARLTEAARQVDPANPVGRARASLIRALLNHNDFVTVR